MKNIKLSSSSKVDLLMLFMVNILVAFLIFTFDFFELVVEFLNQYEKYELDEFIFMFFTLFLSAAIFSIRRQLEIKNIHKDLETINLKLNKEIEQKVKETIAKDILLFEQSKRAIMGEMISFIAHQWRQPLNKISLISTGIKFQKQIDEYDTNKLLEDMNNINQSVQYLSQTIDDFRSFYSPIKKLKEFYIHDIINKSIEFSKKGNIITDIEVVKDFDELKINNYENELLQILIILLNNTYDELIKKEKKSKKLLFISVYSRENKKIISIKDNAGGIPINLIEKVGTPYFTTKGKSGIGLGLYMLKEILCKSIGAKISIENKGFIYKNKSYKGLEVTLKLD